MSNKSDSLTPRRRPSQERSRDRVERILDATASLLDEMPVDKVTTAAIASTADVPIGSVYQYFPNKLAILAELARRVMEKVDAATAELIVEDFGVLPWDQAIDRAVDTTIQGYSQQPGYVQLLLSIRPTPAFREITDESNDRVAAMMAMHPALQAVLPPDRITLITRSAIKAVNALQDWALSIEDDAEAAAEIVVEMKTLLKGYLAVYMGTPSDSPAVRS
ncbi:MAG: TetR/AcrR family transcriptional regulator [Myxococcota bacterium]